MSENLCLNVCFLSILWAFCASNGHEQKPPFYCRLPFIHRGCPPFFLLIKHELPLFLTRYHEFEKSQVFLRFRLGLFALFSLSLPRKHAPLPYPVTLSSRAPLARQTMLFGRSLFSERVYNPILPRFALPSCFSMEKLSASNIAYRTRLSWQTMHKRASKKKRPILLHCGPCPKNDVRRNRPTFLQLTPKRGRLLKT